MRQKETLNNNNRIYNRALESLADAALLAPLCIVLLAASFSIKGPASSGSLASLQPDMYRVAVFSTAYCMTAFLLLLRFHDAMLLVLRNWIYLLFLFFVIYSAQWSAYPEKVFLVWLHYVGCFLTCVVAALGIGDREKRLISILFIFGLIAVASTVVTVIFVPSRGLMEFGDKMRWIGMTLNPNALGSILIVAVWAGMVTLIDRHDAVVRILSLCLLILCAVCLYGTNSMTSIICSLFMTALLLFFRMLEGRRPPVVALAALLTSSLGIAGLIAIYLFAPDLFQVDHFLTAIGRTPTLTGRTELWEVARSAIAERPVLGWGFDAHKSVRQMFHLPVHASHFHNGYLDLMVRGGVVGLLLVGGMLAQCIVRMITSGRGKTGFIVSVAILIVTILAHNLVEATLAAGPHVLWIMLTFFFVYLNHPAATTSAYSDATPAADADPPA